LAQLLSRDTDNAKYFGYVAIDVGPNIKFFARRVGGAREGWQDVAIDHLKNLLTPKW
jgi:hypothetical protein